MKANRGLFLLAASAMIGIFPVAAAENDRTSPEAGRAVEGIEGAVKSQHLDYRARLDDCRRKLAPSMNAKVAGLVETRDELRREYLERRQALLGSNRDLQKIDAEMRVKVRKLKKEKVTDSQKSRAEVEPLVRKRRALEKSLTGTGELKPMADQLKGLEAKIQASASEALSEDPGCVEFKETLTWEATAMGGLQGPGMPGRGNPERTLK